MNAHNEQQGYTAADMADQAAAAFERGRESVFAEQAAAAQGAVAWTVVGPDGKSSIGGWHVMETHDFWKEAGVLREGHRYAYAYAAPVAASPGIDLRRFIPMLDRAEATAPNLAVRQEIAELRALIDASPPPPGAAPEGFVLVPVKPTPAMMQAACECGAYPGMNEWWAAMLAARPQGVK